MLKSRMKKLAKQALHESFTTWKQSLQEGDVSAVSRHEQRDVWQGLDDGDGKSCEERKNT